MFTLRNGPCHVTYIFPLSEASCSMSILRNDHVALSNSPLISPLISWPYTGVASLNASLWPLTPKFDTATWLFLKFDMRH